MEERALSIAEIVEPALPPSLVREEHELRAPNELFKPGLDQSELRRRVRVASINLRPSGCEAFQNKLRDPFGIKFVLKCARRRLCLFDHLLRPFRGAP